MGNNLKLSFIVPCYNVEKYIKDCLDSLLAQDIPESEYEIICVNDCSVDNTREIILDYKRRHCNILLIDNEINKKQGATRNLGLYIAQGKYIWFIDSDDYIENNVIQKLINEMEESELDILNFELSRVDKNNVVTKRKIADTTDVIKGSKFIRQFDEDWQINGSVSTKIFRRSYLEDTQLFFSKSSYLEDQIYSLRSVFYANRFRHFEEYCYYYRYNPESTLNTRMTSNKYMSIFRLSSDLFTFSHEIEREDKKLYSSVNGIALWYLNSVLKQFVFLKRIDRNDVFLFFKEEMPTILKSGYFKGFKYQLLSHHELINKSLFVISPLLRLVRQCKRKTINKLLNAIVKK